MTDSEPIYNYIPGKGWVISCEQFVIGVTDDNRKIRIIARKPVVGELYRARNPRSSPNCENADGSVNLDWFKEDALSRVLSDYSIRHDPSYSEGWIYVVIEPL